MAGYVYFFETGDGLVKIGKANNVEARFKQIKTACPTGLKVLAKIKTDKPFDLESKLHEKFKGNRLQGEWFDISKNDVLKTIKEVKMGFGLNKLDALKKSISYFEEIARKMAESESCVQDADLFFNHEDVKYFEKVIDGVKGWDRFGYHNTLSTLSETLAFNLFMLAQANGSGPAKDVNLQDASRDILGFARILQRHIQLRDFSSYLDVSAEGEI